MDGWMRGKRVLSAGTQTFCEQISLAPPVLHSSFQGSLGIDPSIKVIFGKNGNGGKRRKKRGESRAREEAL